MSKQTAVEWFFEQVEQYVLTHGNLPFNVLRNFKKQAKAMEREQHFESYRQGNAFTTSNSLDFKGDFDDYYNETYGGEQCQK